MDHFYYPSLNIFQLCMSLPSWEEQNCWRMWAYHKLLGGSMKISSLFPSILLQIPKMRGALTSADPWGSFLYYNPWLCSFMTVVSPLFSAWGKTAFFSHMYHSMFIHSDTRNVSSVSKFRLNWGPRFWLGNPPVSWLLYWRHYTVMHWSAWRLCDKGPLGRWGLSACFCSILHSHAKLHTPGLREPAQLHAGTEKKCWDSQEQQRGSWSVCSLPLFSFSIPSSQSHVSAQLTHPLATEHAVELQPEGLASIKPGGNVPRPGGSGDNWQVEAGPQAQVPAHLILYTYPFSSQPSQNKLLLTTLWTVNCEGTW